MFTVALRRFFVVSVLTLRETGGLSPTAARASSTSFTDESNCLPVYSHSLYPAAPLTDASFISDCDDRA